MAISPLAEKKLLAIRNKWSDLEIPPEARENLQKSQNEIFGHVMPWVFDSLGVKHGIWRFRHYGKETETMVDSVAEMLKGCFVLGLEYGLAGMGVVPITHESFRLPAEVRELWGIARFQNMARVVLISDVCVKAGKHSKEEARAFLTAFIRLIDRACFDAYVQGCSTSVNLSK